MLNFNDVRNYSKDVLVNSFENKSTLDKLTTSEDGTLLFDGEEMKGGSEIQFSEMPAPTSEYAGRLIQYIGEDTELFKMGSFYKCIGHDVDETWQHNGGTNEEVSFKLNPLTTTTVNIKKTESSYSGQYIYVTADGVENSYGARSTRIVEFNCSNLKISANKYITCTIQVTGDYYEWIEINNGVSISSVEGNAIETKEDGIYVATPTGYTLPKATTDVLGGVKVDGTTITVDENGVISGASNIEKLEDIGDVELTNIQDKQALLWDSTNSKWINGTVEGGGSSNVYVNRVDKELWSGSISAKGTITLSNDYDEYDEIYFLYTSQKDTYQSSAMSIKTNDITLDLDNDIILCGYSTCFLGGKFVSNNKKSFVITEVGSNKIYLKKIYGIKYSTSNKYSTDETVVGEWIDGKPLYRIALDGGNLIVNSTWKNFEIPDTLNIKSIINSITVGTRDSAKTQASTGFPLIYLDSSTNLKVRGVADSYLDYLILEYTKTTD